MTRAEAIAAAKAAIAACLAESPDGWSFASLYDRTWPSEYGRQPYRTDEGVSHDRCLDAALRQMKRDNMIRYDRKKACWVKA